MERRRLSERVCLLADSFARSLSQSEAVEAAELADQLEAEAEVHGSVEAEVHATVEAEVHGSVTIACRAFVFNPAPCAQA